MCLLDYSLSHLRVLYIILNKSGLTRKMWSYDRISYLTISGRSLWLYNVLMILFHFAGVICRSSGASIPYGNCITLTTAPSSFSPTSLPGSSKAFQSNTTRITFISCNRRNLLISAKAIWRASSLGNPYTPVAISGKAILLHSSSTARLSDFS